MFNLITVSRHLPDGKYIFLMVFYNPQENLQIINATVQCAAALVNSGIGRS